MSYKVLLSAFLLAVISASVYWSGEAALPAETQIVSLKQEPSAIDLDDAPLVHPRTTLELVSKLAVQPLASTEAGGAQVEQTGNPRKLLPLSLANPEMFEQSMGELYQGLDALALRAAYESLTSRLPADLGLQEHREKVEVNDFEKVGQGKLMPNGRMRSVIPPKTSRTKRRYLDRVHGLADGRIVVTSIELGDVPEYANQISEANWLLERIRKQ